jgi:nucleoporin POM152
MLTISGVFSFLTFGLLTNDGYGGKDAHLAGQHTVRMSPISTAQLNPYNQRFCLDASSKSVLVPVLLNNSNPTSLRYTITPLGYTESSGTKIESVTLSARDLKAIENARLERLRVTKTAKQEYYDDNVDDYDDEYGSDDSRGAPSSLPRLQKTQSIVHVRLSKPGTIHLKGVSDPSGVDARISYPSEITIAPCPHAHFVDGDTLTRGDNIKCAAPGLNTLGEDKDVHLTLSIFGVPPLTLKWFKEVNGRREYFIVEGIETERASPTETSTPVYNPPQEVRVPLTVSAEAFGIHTYVLESVTDALGNIEHLSTSWASAKYGDLSSASNVKISRSLRVLHRPSMAFKGCGTQKPASLRIGSNVSLVIDAQEADDLDSPWDVKVRYQPPTDESGKSINKRLRPWQQTIQTQPGKRDLIVEAESPGEYTIVDIRGKYCEGDVLSPETCTVVELPKPAAEIEWRRIHEWYVTFTMQLEVEEQTRYFTALETPGLLPHLSSMEHRPFMCTTECNGTRSRRGN